MHQPSITKSSMNKNGNIILLDLLNLIDILLGTNKEINEGILIKIIGVSTLHFCSRYVI